MPPPAGCKVRTITACITPPAPPLSAAALAALVRKAHTALLSAQRAASAAGFEVQTLRAAFPPLHTWLPQFGDDAARGAALDALDAALAEAGIDFCALGSLVPARFGAAPPQPADATTTAAAADATATAPPLRLEALPGIIAAVVRRSPRFNLAVDVQPGDEGVARAAAAAVLEVSRTTPGGLGNFRLCASAHVAGALPFFPGAVAPARDEGDDDKNNSSSSSNVNNSGGPARGAAGSIGLAVGLENGALLSAALAEAGSLANVPPAVARAMAPVAVQLRTALTAVASELSAGDSDGGVSYAYLGLDSSANPALDAAGSVAAALEKLEQVATFGGSGTLAAAAAVTRALQALPGPLVGYCGLMLPVCEDLRLAELAAEGRLTVAQLLNVSSVCGVGVDTVPVAGDLAPARLAALYLDVAGLAHRWGKALSCRVFPVPGRTAGDATTFDSPYLANTTILPLE